MDEFINKSYRLETSDNFDDYLKYIGIGFISRKTARALSPIVRFEKNADSSYTFIMSTSLRTITTTFHLDEEFVEQRADGIKVRTVFKIENGKLVQIQLEDNGRRSIHVREFRPDTLTVVTTADGWDGVCTRTYTLVD